MTAGKLRQAQPTAAITAAAVPADWQLNLQSSPALPTVEALSSPSLPTVEAPELPPPTSSTTAAAAHQVKDILADFADVLNQDGHLPPSTHGVEHHIVTSGHPITAKFRRLDNIKLAAGSELKTPGAGAVPKQAGSKTLYRILN